MKLSSLLISSLLLLVTGCKYSFLGCSNQGSKRLPSSYQYNIPEIPNNLGEATLTFYNYIISDEFGPKECAPILSGTYKKLFQIKEQHFDLSLIENQKPEILNRLWLIRLELRKKLKLFHKNGQLDIECTHGIRAAFRAARFIEDLLGEMITKPTPYNPKKRIKVLTGNFPWLLTNPDPEYNDFKVDTDIRSGDIIITRGNAFSSAAIARLGEGDIDSQFSHLSLVYIDENDSSKKYTIEAHIEMGVVVAPLDKHLTSENNRAMIFRYPDKDLAHIAAYEMYKIAKARQDDKDNIPYDFGFDGKKHDELFCSEVATQGFKIASHGEIIIPMFESKLKMKNDKFLKDIGIKVKQGFIPADITVDPRFDLIAEWRDFSRMRDNHIKDAILTKMFEWMDSYNYQIHVPISIEASARTAYLLRKISLKPIELLLPKSKNWTLFENPLVKKFPTNMSLSALKTILTLRKIGDAILTVLVQKDAEYKKNTGLHMTAKSLHEELEKLRRNDLETYKKYRRYQRFLPDKYKHIPIFHRLFRAK